MKKMISVLTVFLLVISTLSMPTLAATNEDMRAVWISTVYNLDYPSSKNNIEAQKNEFIEKLDMLKAIGINTVVVQVRPKADALYKSSINPWSDVLTGTQGKDPGYDPMAFMIEAAHERGMAFHAWLNPYRVTTTGTDLTVLSENHPARLNPSWTFSYNNALYYNPEVEEVKAHIVDTVTEIATNYNVDAIHFDDYFYPSSYPLPTGEHRDGQVANNRRAAVNEMVSRVSAAIKKVNTNKGKKISFGISPAGIWKNSTSDATGSNTGGNESYYSVYADTRTWIKNEWVDYIVPQIYWETGHAKADYETLVKWWSNEVKGTSVKLYIGQGVYRDAVATQIDTQLTINQKYSDVKGSFYFSLRDILNNRMNCKDKLTSFYQKNPVTGTGSGSTSGSTNTGSGSTSGSTGDGTTNSGGNQTGTVVDPNAVGKVGTVTAETLNIRSGARTDRPLITKAAKNTQVTILSILGDWYKVQLPTGEKGWAHAAYIKVGESASTNTDKPNNTAPTTKTGTVTAASLNIRSGAGTTYNIVGKAAKGTKVTILLTQGNWYKVKLANGTVGWASTAYIK